MHYIDPELQRFGVKETSQNDEDGIIRRLNEIAGLTSGSFAEFGIGPPAGRDLTHGLEGNFVALRRAGWNGVFWNGDGFAPDSGVRQQFVTPLTINSIFRKHALPRDLDWLSIDIDGQDFWVWLSLDWRPRFVIVEYNAEFGPEISKTIAYDPSHAWDGTIYYGASLAAFEALARDKGYVLVYANGVNGFFVRSDMISNPDDFSLNRLFVGLSLHAPDHLGRPWVEI